MRAKIFFRCSSVVRGNICWLWGKECNTWNFSLEYSFIFFPLGALFTEFFNLLRRKCLPFIYFLFCLLCVEGGEEIKWWKNWGETRTTPKRWWEKGLVLQVCTCLLKVWRTSLIICPSLVSLKQQCCLHLPYYEMMESIWIKLFFVYPVNNDEYSYALIPHQITFGIPLASSLHPI